MSLVASSGAAMRRSPMPVRSRIHASVVSTRLLHQILVGDPPRGQYVPVPMIRERSMSFSCQKARHSTAHTRCVRRSAVGEKLLSRALLRR